MTKITIQCEELPSLREAKDFFKEMLIAYMSDCEEGTFEFGMQTVKWKIE